MEDLLVAADEALPEQSYVEQETVDFFMVVAEPKDDFGDGVNLGMVLQELGKDGCFWATTDCSPVMHRISFKIKSGISVIFEGWGGAHKFFSSPCLVFAFLVSISTQFAPKGTLLVGAAEMDLLRPTILRGMRGKGLDCPLLSCCI